MTSIRRAAIIFGVAALAASCSGRPDDRDGGPSDSAATSRPTNTAGTADTPAIAAGRSSAPPSPDVDSAAPVDPDTARGLIAVVGADPMTRVTLRDSAGGALTLSGRHVGPLSRLAGIEVWVAGRRSNAELVTNRFVVRAVDGTPARDGRLVARAGGLGVRLANGTTIRLQNPPAPLRAHIGKRIWVTLSASGEVESFGVIE